MTAKELIEVLEAILDEREGKDLDIRMDVNFEASYGIWSATVFEGLHDDGEDILILSSPEAEEAAMKYDPRLKIPEEIGLN